MDEKYIDVELKKAVEFHGHLCPGLVIGYRIAKRIRENYPRSEDEELICIVENNSCSVDAIQALLGCTFGKCNLIYKENGKQAFTVYSRNDHKALRIYFKGDHSSRMDDLRGRYFRGDLSEDEKREFEALRKESMQRMITAPAEDVLSVQEVEIPEPKKARIYPSLKCQMCGEGFMEICGRTISGKVVCKECFHKMAA